MQDMSYALFTEVSGCILSDLIRIRGNQHTATHVRKSPLVTRAAQGTQPIHFGLPAGRSLPRKQQPRNGSAFSLGKEKKRQRGTSSATTRRAGGAGISDYGSFCGTTNPHRSARDSIIVTPYIFLL